MLPGLLTLPYFEQPRLHIGPFTVYAFGILLVTGILAARYLILRRAALLGLDAKLASTLCVVMLIPGFVAAYLGKIVLPDLAAVVHHPAVLLNPGKGFGSFGGLGGGFLAGLVWMRRRGLDPMHRWFLLDNIVYALPIGFLFGRLGCALAHDHRGLLSTSWIAIRFPEGPRFDLGLIEFLFLIPLAVLFLYLGRQPRPPGYFMALFGTVYGCYRIWQDTLHVQRLTYVGGAVTSAIGLASWLVLRRSLWANITAAFNVRHSNAQ